jgi:hypothetical protein
MVMDMYLQYYFYPGYHRSIVRIYNLESRLDYTPKAKKRIKEILEGKKTREEYILYFVYNRTSYNNPQTGWDKAAKIMKTREVRSATVLKQLRDSIVETYVIEEAKRDFEAAGIEPDLIKMIGLLEMKECIPVLKQKLAECLQDYQWEEAYRYALARLGDKEQRQYILETMNIQDFLKEDFLYFQDDEMIWRYIDVSYSSGEQVSFDSEGSILATLMTMNNVYPYIKNVPPKFIYPFISHDMALHYQWAKAFYEWLMENKDKIEFDYTGEKEWFW